MITINIYAYVNNAWVEQANFTRPVSGSNKLDETLDSAVADFTKQATENRRPPFKKIKVVANDGTTTLTEYSVIGSPESSRPRMSD